MRRFLALLVTALFAFSVATGSLVHASELGGCADSTVEHAAGHDNCEAAHSPEDADHATPHQHGGCHGHHISTSPDAMTASARTPLAERALPGNSAGLAQGVGGPALRPPIA